LMTVLRDRLRDANPMATEIIIVVVGVTSHQGGGESVSHYRAKGIRFSACESKEVCAMQNAERILQALHDMGVKRTPLTRVYRSLYSEDMSIEAYAKIYKNAGALTPGTEGETADEMSMDVVRDIIEQMRHERFRFRPSLGTGVPKKS